jgi:carbamoyltransferase
MITCGLKLTHDGSVALIEDDALVFSVEMEKLGNGARYSAIEDLAVIGDVLAQFGYRPSDVDRWVIDGWDGDAPAQLSVTDQGIPYDLQVGPYRESRHCPELTTPSVTGEITIGGRRHRYASHQHVAGHAMSAYCSSPFAASSEPAFVLVWDGGLFPRLYWVDPAKGVRNCGALFGLIGHAYATAAHHFGPFRRERQSATVTDLSVAGKLMAYIAVGKVRGEVVGILADVFHQLFESDDAVAVAYRRDVGGFGSLVEPSMPPLHRFFSIVRDRVDEVGYSDVDILASVHEFLGRLLVERVTAMTARLRDDGPWNLCFAGGCALNIKWNSALRRLPIFSAVWVPPFPNDSGSAIGAAALGMIQDGGVRAFSWQPRLGPELLPAPRRHDGWAASACSAARLAEVLHVTGEPVVVLHGRAELGPRALGGRSILAVATDGRMKDELNRVKSREAYRPVAPICLVDRAPEIFDPGSPDPHMLFDHEVRDDWLGMIPAVVHLDGTARLQTVAREDDPFLFEVLTEYERRSGIPVLCNTSANFNGRGFFPDVASAMAWGRIDRIFADGVLYERSHNATTDNNGSWP